MITPYFQYCFREMSYSELMVPQASYSIKIFLFSRPNFSNGTE
jgi:hypothetical protein